MKKLLAFGVVVLACAFVISLVSEACAQEKVITLRYSAFHPAGNANSVLCEQWGKEVEKRTNGRIKVNYYPGGILTPPAQTFDSVVRGIADIGFSMATYTKGRFPLTEVIDLPLGYTSSTQSTRLANALYKKFRAKEFDDVHVLYMGGSPLQRLFMKQQPITKLEEFKGKKIRSGGVSVKVVQLLGGAPVGMPITDVYDSLSKGIIDGVITGYEPMKAYKLAEVVQSATEFHSTWITESYTVMNKQKWASISPEDQKAIDAINAEWIEKQAKLWEALDQEGKDIFLQRKGKIVKLSKEEDARWTKTMSPMLDEYVKDMKTKGLPGDEALKFCLDWLKAN